MHPLNLIRKLIEPEECRRQFSALGLERAPRFAGAGAGAGFSSPPPWTPAALSPVLWQGPGTAAGRVTYASQPVLVDRDMEAATMAAWSANNPGTWTKQSPGYAGSRCARGEATAGANTDMVQHVLIVGNRYLATSKARGDGVTGTVPRIRVYPSAAVGTSDNAWQDLRAEGTATADSFHIETIGTSGYSEHDAVTLVNLSLSSYAPQIGAALAQAVPTAMPWVDPLTGHLRYQAGDMLQAATAKALLRCLHDGTGATFSVCVKPKVINARNFVFTTIPQGGSTDVGVSYEYKNDGSHTFTVGNGGGGTWALSLAFSFALSVDIAYVITYRAAAGANGVNVRINSVSCGSGTIASPSANDPNGAGLFIGSLAAGSALSVDGLIPDYCLVPRVLSDAECSLLERFMYTESEGVAPPW